MQQTTPNEVYMTIEISDNTVKAVVAEYHNMKINVLASKEKEFDLDKNLEDKNELKKAIFEIKDEITALLGYEMKNTIVVMPSYNCKIFYDKVRVEPASGSVVREDMARGINQIIDKNTSTDKFVTNVVINRMSAYSYGFVSDPIGLETRYIELECSIYTIPTAIAYPLLQIIEECGYNIVDVCIDILAITSAAVMPSALKEGAVIVDIQASATNIAYFKNNTMMNIKTINMGSDDIAKEIATKANIDLDKARSFARKFVNMDINNLDDLIIYKYFDEITNQEITLSQKDVSVIAYNKLKVLISLILEHLESLELGVDDIVYINDSGNHINNLDQLLKYDFNYPYKLITSKTIGARSPSFIKCIGAKMYHANFSRLKGEVKIFVNQKDYQNALNLVEQNKLLYNNHKGEQEFIKRLVTYIFNN